MPIIYECMKGMLLKPQYLYSASICLNQRNWKTGLNWFFAGGFNPGCWLASGSIQDRLERDGRCNWNWNCLPLQQSRVGRTGKRAFLNDVIQVGEGVWKSPKMHNAICRGYLKGATINDVTFVLTQTPFVTFKFLRIFYWFDNF